MSQIKELISPVLPSSLWAKTSSESGYYPPAEADAETSVLIIGAGFTGLSTAIHLAEQGVSVMVVDAGEPGFGASGRNGGQVIPGLKFDPDALDKLLGPDLGGRTTRTIGQAADNVFNLVNRYDIQCESTQSGWIQPAHAPTTLPLIKGRAAQWERRGVAVQSLDAKEVADMIGCRPVYAGGWLDPRGGSVQPLSYARGLARAATSLGVKVRSNTRITALTRHDGGWKARHTQSNIYAESVVLATNGYSDGLHGPLARSVVPAFSLQVATEPLPESVASSILQGGQAVSDSRRLLWYYRMDAHRRLVMGGRGPSKDKPALQDGREALKAIRTLFPQLRRTSLDYVWAGRVAMTTDHLPHLHRLDRQLYSAVGYNGRGVAMGTTMGQLLAQMVLGENERSIDFPVTTVKPIALRSLSRFGVASLTQYYRFRDYLESRG